MSRIENGPVAGPSRAFDPPSGSDAGYDAETVAAWMARDAEVVAAENRIKSFGKERLRADVRSLASEAVATLRELLTGPDVPASVRLRASLAILQAADALAIEGACPMSAEGVRAAMERAALIESLGG